MDKEELTISLAEAYREIYLLKLLNIKLRKHVDELTGYIQEFSPVLKNKNMYNNRYFHYWNKLKFDYNECLGRIASTKPVKKHMRRMKTLEWRIRINRKEFIVNPLGGKTYFPPF